jgi:RNA polymerase subunit RPABC4/transcription elongation factor Spt4
MSDLLKPVMPYITLTSQLCLVFYLVFVCALAFWIWRDARLRGAMPLFWAIAVVPFSIATWAIYMMVRPPEALDDVHEREVELALREAELQVNGSLCPNCFKPVEHDFLICPTCMKKLKRPCDSCGRAIKPSWSVCPYCKAKQSPTEARADAPQPVRPAWTADPLAVSDPAPADPGPARKPKSKPAPAAEQDQ